MGSALNLRPIVAILIAGFVVVAMTACAQLHEKPAVATGFECIPAPDVGTPVQVLDEEGRPVAGAFVTWFEELPDGARELAPEPELSALRRKLGKTVVTNANGETRVGRYDCIVASSRTSYAATRLQRQYAPLTLRLRPSRSITIVTVDAQQRPVAEVPIVVESTLRPNNFEFEWRASTDTAGAATFAPVDLFTPTRLDNARRLQVSVDAPLRVPRDRCLAGNELPAEPIRFEMPPTGRLVLDAFEVDGRPLERIQTTTLRPASDRKSIAWEAWDDRSHHELPHVETGMVFDAEVQNDDWELEARQPVTGPQSPGETVAVRIVAATHPRLSARLLDDRGEPLADRDVDWIAAIEGRRSLRSLLGSTRTDGDGRASIRLRPASLWTEPSVHRCWITIAARDGRTSRVDWTGAVELARDPEDRSDAPIGRELGEVRLTRSKLVVSGVVVDDTGAPASGVRIGVKIDRAGVPDEDGIVWIGGGEFADPLLWTTSGRDGAFEVFADDQHTPLYLTVSRGSSEREFEFGPVEHVSFPQGTTDLRISLSRLGTLAGRVVGPANELRDVELRLHGRDLHGDPVQWWSERVAVDGSFECALPAGSWTLRIKPAGEGVGPGVKFELTPGGVVTLAPIELRAQTPEASAPHAR